MGFVWKGFAAALVALAIFVAAENAFAIDFYEIQIYPTETDQQYHLDLELHSNTITTAVGHEAKTQLDAYQIHETFEATYGLLPYLEVGQYLCTAKLDNGHYEYAGSRTKAHFGIPQTMDWPVSFGGNVELDYMRRAAEDQPLTLEMRPIAETHSESSRFSRTSHSTNRLRARVPIRASLSRPKARSNTNNCFGGCHPRSSTMATWDRFAHCPAFSISSSSSCRR